MAAVCQILGSYGIKHLSKGNLNKDGLTRYLNDRNLCKISVFRKYA